MNGQVTRLVNANDQYFDQKSIVYSQSKILMFITDEYINAIKSGRKNIEDFYKSLRNLSVHDAKSLLYIENALTNKSFENLEYDNDDYRNLLIVRLKNWQSPIDRYNFLIKCKAEGQLPEKYLEWFKNDLRCALVLTSLISHLLSNEAYKGKEELINAITDFLRYNMAYFNSNIDTNRFYLERTLSSGDWKVSYLLPFKSTYLKNRTQDKDLRWLKSSDDEQVEWAYSYLYNATNESILLQGIFFPETIEEKYELILAHLDMLSNIERPYIGTKEKKGFSERSYTLYSMKKAWEGQKHYSQKKQVENGSIKIYKKNQDKLEALMAYSGFTANKMINRSIEQMYAQLIEDNKRDENDS